MVLSSGGPHFALFQSSLELFFSSLFLSKHVVRVALLFSTQAPCMAASTAVSLKWASDNPFNLSFETLGLQTSLPLPESLENHLI